MTDMQLLVLAGIIYLAPTTNRWLGMLVGYFFLGWAVLMGLGMI